MFTAPKVNTLLTGCFSCIVVHVYEVGVKRRAQESARRAPGESACGGRERDPAAAPLRPAVLQKSINIGL